MFKFILFLSAIVCALGASVPGDWLSHSNGRIVGGEETTIESYPYVVTLQFLGSHMCGAFIVNHKYIVSAAHCVVTKVVHFYTVRAGCTHSNRGGVIHSVDFLKVHNDYNENTLENDISIFRVTKCFEFNHKIQSIGLPTTEPVNGDLAEVIGYGVIEFGGDNPFNVLRVAHVHIVDKEKCASDLYGYGSLITNNVICAENDGKDSCQGDSGGPLVVGDVVVGIVSWGKQCAEPGYPGVYTKVAAYVTWIKDNTETD